MNEQITAYLAAYPDGIAALFNALRQLLFDSVSVPLTETMWAKMPSYYASERFVRLIPFKDHINIEAAAMLAHTDELSGCKITPKGMLQVYEKQEIPAAVLARVFQETLSIDNG